MKAEVFLVSALALAPLVGCGADFDPGSYVGSLRVLTVQADNPYAAPGETVRFEATAYDPAGRTVEWAWLACPNPVSSEVESCLIDIAEEAIVTGNVPLLAMGPSQSSASFVVPEGALDGIPLEARPNALSGVMSIACPGTLTIDLSRLDAASSEGLLPFVCTDDSGAELGLHDAIAGVKRVFLRETDRNDNPVIADVTFDGEPWALDDVKEVDACDRDDFDFDACKNRGAHRIAAVLTPESFQAGVDEFGRDFAESLVIQHYATEGIFEDEARVAELPETRWVARTSGSGQEQRLWFVARDDRGGVSVAERRVRVR